MVRGTGAGCLFTHSDPGVVGIVHENLLVTGDRMPARKKSSTRKKTTSRKKSASQRKTATRKKATGATRKKTAAKTSRKRRTGTRKYSKSAGREVETEMREMKSGKLRSGQSGEKVTSRKQAIAIGLSKARRAGKRVPPNPNR
jgi:hypothetical protein